VAYDTIKVETNDRVCVITLNEPDRLNALSDRMAVEFKGAVEGLKQRSDVRAVIVTGAGRAFSAGGNFAEMKKNLGGDPAVCKHRIYGFYKSFLSVMDLPVPTIAAINGPAMGAGACITLACDMRIAAEGSRIGFAFARIGIHPGMGAEYFLPRIVGRAKACELLMTAEEIPAEEALRIGLVNHVAPPEELMDRAVGLASKIASRPALPIRMLKESIDAALASDLESTLHREAAYQGICFMTGDMREGIEAFIEKRKPVFKDEY